jgi:hypothetical protein
VVSKLGVRRGTQPIGVLLLVGPGIGPAPASISPGLGGGRRCGSGANDLELSKLFTQAVRRPHRALDIGLLGVFVEEKHDLAARTLA